MKQPEFVEFDKSRKQFESHILDFHETANIIFWCFTSFLSTTRDNHKPNLLTRDQHKSWSTDLHTIEEANCDYQSIEWKIPLTTSSSLLSPKEKKHTHLYKLFSTWCVNFVMWKKQEKWKILLFTNKQLETIFLFLYQVQSNHK